MSPSGQYVVVNRGTYEVYDRQMNFLRSLNVYAGGHADMGYDTAGNEVMVSSHFEGGKGVITTTTVLPITQYSNSFPVFPSLPGFTKRRTIIFPAATSIVPATATLATMRSSSL